MTKLVACVLAAALLIACSPAVRATERATPDDTARFLAGLRPSPGSPLNTLTKSAVWQRHAALFDTLFELKDRTSLSKIRIFATKEIPCMSSEHFGPGSGNLREYLAHLV